MEMVGLGWMVLVNRWAMGLPPERRILAMPETEKEKLNRIGNLIYLTIVFMLAACGVTAGLIAALG